MYTKNRWARFLSGFISFVLVFCMLPVAVFAADPFAPTIRYRLENGTTNGQGVSEDEPYYDEITELQSNNSPATISVTPGESFTPALPTVTTYTSPSGTTEDVTVTYTLTGIAVRGKNVNETMTPSEMKSITLPEDITAITIYYKWTRTQTEIGSGTDPDEGDDPTIPDGEVTNIIASLDRTVIQHSTKLTPMADTTPDTYVLENEDKTGVALTYDATMDMEVLGGIFGNNSWTYLNRYYKWIDDSTVVRLHFELDNALDASSFNFENAKLESDMFVMDSYQVNEEKNEIVLTCHWSGAKASQARVNKDVLDPMIKLTGVTVNVSSTWPGEAVTINNHGYVEGDVYCGDPFTANGSETPPENANLTVNHMAINGGTRDDQFILTIIDKDSLPGMEKTVQTGTDGSGNPIWGESDTAAAGDTITFKLESNVPENLDEYMPNEPMVMSVDAESSNYVLEFHDMMDERLALNADSFDVKLGGQDIDEKYYSVYIAPNTNVTDTCTFEVYVDLMTMRQDGVITDADIENLTKITVTYTATLSGNAGVDKYINEAWVHYPDDDSRHDTVPIYIYGIEIFKYDQADETKGLAGAKFALYGADAVNKDEDGNVTLISGVAPIKDNISSGNDGKVTIEGLDAGTYYLVETDAPTGYVKNSTPLEIVIPDDAGDDCWVRVKFANSEIPGTGGTGTMMFTIGGAAILAAAGALFVISRRPRKEQEF